MGLNDSLSNEEQPQKTKKEYDIMILVMDLFYTGDV